jgi:hypothetical protein
MEAWEAAAQVERMLGRWHHNQGRSLEADTHLARAAAYAARVPPGETMCMIAYDQAYRFVTSGQPEQALALADEMIPLADHGGLEVGRALLQTWRGWARVDLGDAGGIADMRDAAESLAVHAHPRAIAAYGNLGDLIRGLTGITAADAIYAEAAKWASRFALPFYIDWITSERAYQAYHTACWDDARQLIAQVDVMSPNNAPARVTRGHLALGDGNADQALTVAEAIVAYGVSAGSDEDLYYGTALQARCHDCLGNDAAALDACDRFLARWLETGGLTSRSLELCEIAAILAQADRHDDIRRSATLLNDACRWREALLLTADTNYPDAATLYEEIGSKPLAADVLLLAAHQAANEGRLADAAHHAQAVLAFADQTGAAFYQRRAETLIAASA